MKTIEKIGLGSEEWGRVCAVLDCQSSELPVILNIGGIDPSKDLRGLMLYGWPLAGQDVRGFDFSECDLRKTGIEKSRYDKTTIFTGARFDRAARKIFQPNDFLKIRNNTPRPKPPVDGYTMIRLPDLSDAEMLEHSFLVPVPEAQPNVTAAAPPIDQWLTYEGRYELGHDVVCAFAHRHRKGYIFRDEQELRYLIGHNCGAKHFGLGNWKSFTKERESLEDRAGYLKVIRDLDAGFRAHRDWVATLHKSPTVRAYDELRKRIQNIAPSLVSAARRVLAQPNSQLNIRVQVRDFASEEKARERQVARQKQFDALPPEQRGNKARPAVERSAMFKTELQSLGTLAGRPLFRSDDPMAVRAKQDAMLVDAFLSRPESKLSKRELRTFSENARELANRLRDYSYEIAHAIEFFATENLERVAQWSNENRVVAAKLTVIPGGLRIVSVDGDNAEALVKPASLTQLDSAPAKELLALARLRTH